MLFLVYEDASHSGHYSPDFSQTYINDHFSEYTEIAQVLADGGDRYGVSAITFDTNEELIWMGNQGVKDKLLYKLYVFKFTLIIYLS